MGNEKTDRGNAAHAPQAPKKKQSVYEQAAAVASKIALQKFCDLKKKYAADQHDKRLRNTKLLLRNYRNFVDYNENAIYETAQLCGDDDAKLLEMIGLDTSETRRVESIRSNVVRTRMIMEHIQEMLEVYKKRCGNSKKPEVNRRWRVLEALYLSEESKEPHEIAELEHISISQVYQDVNNATEDLSKLFFGLQLIQFYE